MYQTFTKVDDSVKLQEVTEKAKLHFKKYDDAGHGWLAVKANLLPKYRIADKISAFSYQKGQTVYLEEDSDMDIFIQALLDAKVLFTIEYSNNSPERSAIRSYSPYKYRSVA